MKLKEDSPIETVENDRQLMQGSGAPLGANATAFARSERTMLHVLERRQSDSLNKTWLTFDGAESISFADAHEAVMSIARAIGGYGFERGSRIGVFLSNGIELVLAILGVQRAHCVAVPMHGHATAAVLASMVDVAEPVAIITSVDKLSVLSKMSELASIRLVVAIGNIEDREISGVPVVSWDKWISTRGEIPERLPDSTQPAFIQFTSGTTGMPKGALYSHHYFYMFSAISADAHEHRSSDVLSTPLPLYHAAALHHVVMASLHVGSTAHIKSRFSASKIWEQAEIDKSTFIVLMGSMAEMIVEKSTSNDSHSVDKVFCTPPPSDVGQFEKDFGVRIYWQTYGMTEILPNPMLRPTSESLPPNCVGRPACWTDFGVVDERGELLPQGEIGEFVFRPRIPRMMADEYFNQPAETAEAFRGLVFHTGDHGFYDETGMLYFTGRGVDRIRRRGENISSSEIERIALLYPGLEEVAVYGVPSELLEDEIKIDFVGERVVATALRKYLEASLPAYMVPRFFEKRTSFPRTPSERVKKNLLKAEGTNRASVIDATFQFEDSGH